MGVFTFLFRFGSLDLNKNRSNPYQKSASLFAKKSCWQTVGSRVCDFTDRMTKQSIETAMLLVEKVFVRNVGWVDNNTFLINKVISGRISLPICYLSLSEKRQFVFGKNAIITFNTNFPLVEKLSISFFIIRYHKTFTEIFSLNYYILNIKLWIYFFRVRIKEGKI